MKNQKLRTRYCDLDCVVEVLTELFGENVVGEEDRWTVDVCISFRGLLHLQLIGVH